MRWNKKVSTILSLFFISSLMLLSFRYAINTTSNDIDPQNGLADSPWPRFRGNNQGTGLSPYNTRFVDGMEKCNVTIRDNVTYKIGHEKYNSTIASQPVIGNNGTIYVCTSDGYIYAIKDGKVKWNLSIGVWTEPAIAKDGTLYVTTGHDNLTAISPDGDIKWTVHVEVGGYLSSTPVIDEDGNIYATTCYEVVAFSPDGKVKWKKGGRMGTGPVSPSFPVIGYDGNIYFGSDDYHFGVIFYSISKSGERNWKNYDAGQTISTSPAVGEDEIIYFGSTDGLYAMQTNGSIDWTFSPTGNEMLISPAIDRNGYIYICWRHKR